ncbi:hypothetical protein D3587_15550 [Salmonella enterica]|uniref:Uncharacterized protein n=1 Tax=Salmonella enterica TaxID=28901 RepID=A0A7U5YUS2_SALER|nr:hypothetical protein CHC34_24415 [Salmonella enterica]EAP0953512.1 hypothetical protein [Salmonella enterica]EBK1009922.1 hypothetical protein [Salmonella enterica]
MSAVLCGTMAQVRHENKSRGEQHSETVNFFITNTSSDFSGENNTGYVFFSRFVFLPDMHKNMRQVFSSSRLFSAIIKIISDIREDFQTDIVFVYPDDLIFLSFCLCR